MHVRKCLIFGVHFKLKCAYDLFMNCKYVHRVLICIYGSVQGHNDDSVEGTKCFSLWRYTDSLQTIQQPVQTKVNIKQVDQYLRHFSRCNKLLHSLNGAFEFLLCLCHANISGLSQLGLQHYCGATTRPICLFLATLRRYDLYIHSHGCRTLLRVNPIQIHKVALSRTSVLHSFRDVPHMLVNPVDLCKRIPC